MIHFKGSVTDFGTHRSLKRAVFDNPPKLYWGESTLPLLHGRHVISCCMLSFLFLYLATANFQGGYARWIGHSGYTDNNGGCRQWDYPQPLGGRIPPRIVTTGNEDTYIFPWYILTEFLCHHTQRRHQFLTLRWDNFSSRLFPFMFLRMYLAARLISDVPILRVEFLVYLVMNFDICRATV